MEEKKFHFERNKMFSLKEEFNWHVPTHFGSLLRFDQMPDFFPLHVLTVGPFTSKPGSQISEQFDPCATFEFVQSVGS